MTAALAATLATVFAGAPSATAAPAGVYHFHPHDTRYQYNGAHGSFTGDVIYASQNPDGGNRLFWSLRLSPSVQAIVQGPMNCGAVIDGVRGYSDYHPGIPADYWWHSRVLNLRLDTTYVLRAHCEFTATNGHTTAPGNVQYTVEFTLHST
ncbi:hypothetical protein [Nocardia brasiliensis]|uniref:hypothetical protein n=1 Tax=Nocardia brasiliensis TaxID=37326 RepID=UPI0018944D75|nr:hypothetical protein [Nocardia brasiliensis]MBF6127787.1 hypothetical protein [Nocardia brasiliensis]